MTKFALSRYERHVDIPEIGAVGQQKLFNASVLVAGLGGLGCPAALYLAAAGIGRIGVADQDTVSLSNLQRQILYSEKDVGRAKADVAAESLARVSSACMIDKIPSFLTPENAREHIAKYDIVLDCTDNFNSRYLINAACHAEKKPLVSASLYHHDGQIALFKGYTDTEPCYQCLYPQSDRLDLAPSCREAGILGPVAGILGTMQAALAIKEILALGDAASGWMLMFNTLTFDTQKIKIVKNKNCAACGSAAIPAVKTTCGTRA